MTLYDQTKQEILTSESPGELNTALGAEHQVEEFLDNALSSLGPVSAKPIILDILEAHLLIYSGRPDVMDDTYEALRQTVPPEDIPKYFHLADEIFGRLRAQYKDTFSSRTFLFTLSLIRARNYDEILRRK